MTTTLLCGLVGLGRPNAGRTELGGEAVVVAATALRGSRTLERL